MSKANAIAIDVGGTTFELARVDAAGKVSARESHETRRFTGSADLLAFIGQRAAALASKTQPTVVGAGIGMPGPVREDGVLIFAPNLPGSWREVDVKAAVTQASGLSTFPLNDGNAAAVGEHRFGAGRGRRTLALYTLGTGIGGGLIVEGKLLVGGRGRAAELGHATIQADGPRCGCGNRGCVEALTAIPAMVARTHSKLQRGRQSALVAMVKGDLTRLDREEIGRLLNRAAKLGDVVALEVIQETAELLAAAVASVVAMLDPDTVILGGGIAKLGPPLFAPLRRAVAARTMGFNFDVATIVPAQLDNAGLVGAGAWALENA